MKTRQRHRTLRPGFLLFGACTSCYLLFFVWYEYGIWTQNRLSTAGLPGTESKGQTIPKDYTSLHLTIEQCDATFPDLTKDIQAVVALGPFDLHPSGLDGPLQVRIQDGKAQISTLHLLHRALVTSPEPLPSTILTINIHDQPFGSALSYTRPAFRPPPSTSTHGPPLTRAFLMPHFSFWAWALPSIVSMSRAAEAIDAIEAAVPFARKDPRLAWRGTTGWNSAHYPGQREELLRVVAAAAAAGSAAKGWADVQALTGYDLEDGEEGPTVAEKKEKETEGGNGGNALMIEDFCRYKYVLYTEGITYSGRLQFLQRCGSVLVAPPVAWLQHTTHFMRPVWSTDLYLPAGEIGWQPDEGAREAWPRYPVEEANAVFVAPDWSDLERTVKWLEDHPAVAQGIAARQREMFVGKGYLSPAAEVCYWRALVKAWSEVARYDEAEWGGRDVSSWETFSLGHIV